MRFFSGKGGGARPFALSRSKKTMTVKKEEEINEAPYIACHIESDAILHEATQCVGVLFPRHGQLDPTIALELLYRFRKPIF